MPRLVGSKVNRFTEAELKTMRNMYDNYYSYKEIGHKLGRSKLSIQQKVFNLKWPRRDQSVLELVKWHGRAVLRHGKTTDTINKGLQVKIVAMRESREKAFTEFAKSVPTQPRDACILKAHLAGVSANRMALHIGLTRQRVAEIIRSFNKGKSK